MSQLISVIPKTSFELDGRESSTQEVVLADGISTLGFTSGVLIVRVHTTSGFEATAQAKVNVYNQSVDGNDPATFFVGTTAIAETAAITSTSGGKLLVDELDAPISSAVRVVVEWSRGHGRRLHLRPPERSHRLVLGGQLVGPARLGLCRWPPG